jgi:foldase protein PrsA
MSSQLPGRFASALLLAGALILSSCTSQKSAILNRPVLKINQTEISTQAFADSLALKLKDYDALYAKDESNLKRAKEQTIQQFILEEVEESYAKKNKIEISDKEVDDEVGKVRERYPDDLAFRRMLAQENLPMDRWKKDLRFTLLQKKISNLLAAAVPEPSEDELKDFYEHNKAQFHTPARVMLRQIVVEKEADAKRMMDQLTSGGDFARLAKEFSVAPEGANGGNTGWIEKGTLDVFDMAFKMNTGTRSKIIKSPYGYHIYEVLKKEPEAHLSFNEAKAKIRAQLKEQKTQVAFSAWLEKEVKKTSVYRNDELIQSIKVTTRGN